MFITAEHVSFDYIDAEQKHFRALFDINLEIEAGEFVAILGSNGSGKSTLAKLFNALLIPTSGKIFIDGLDTSTESELWKIRQKVGMVFQNPDNQIIAAIVEDDVAFGPENLGIEPEEIRRRVDESLLAVKMHEFKKFEPHKLSGGQKQRVAIAGTLAMQTRAIVFDEPTAMLDPIGRSEVLSTIKKLHDEKNITVILITHFMEEAIEADRILILNHGELVKNGKPSEIFSNVESIKEFGLELPFAVEIANRLRKKNIQLPRNILTELDLIKALKKY